MARQKGVLLGAKTYTRRIGAERIRPCGRSAARVRSIVRCAATLLLATALSTCGGIKLEQLTDATQITVINTFGQLVHIGAGAANPNPTDDPTGTGYAIAYYLTLKLVDAGGAAAHISLPPKQVTWRDTLGGLTKCLIVRPKMDSSHPDPSKTDPTLPQPSSIKIALCNVMLDATVTPKADGSGTLEKVGGGSVDAPFLGTALNSFVQLAFFTEQVNPSGLQTDLTFVNPLPYLTALSDYSSASAVNVAFELPNHVPSFSAEVFTNGSPTTAGTSVPIADSGAMVDIDPQNQMLIVHVDLAASGAGDAPGVPTAFPYELTVDLNFLDDAAQQSAGSGPTCQSLVHRTFRMSTLPYKVSGNLVYGSIASRSILSSGNYHVPAALYSALVSNIPADVTDNSTFSTLIPLGIAPPAANGPLNFFADGISPGLPLQKGYYFLSVKFRGSLLDPTTSIEKSFALKVANPTKAPVCLAIKTAKEAKYQPDPADEDAKFLQIGHWAAGNGGFADTNPPLNPPADYPSRAPKNGAAPQDNFIDHDIDRFFLEVFDYTKIGAGHLSAGLGVAAGDKAGQRVDASSSSVIPSLDDVTYTNYYDDVTEIPLTEGIDPDGGSSTGHFFSRSQLLTAPDFATYSGSIEPDEGPLGLVSDDDFGVNDGSGTLVADDLPGDRTHKATIDSFVDVVYPYVPHPNPADNVLIPGSNAVLTIPVCERSSSGLHKLDATVHLRAFILKEPNLIHEETGGTYWRDVTQVRDFSAQHITYASEFATHGTLSAQPTPPAFSSVATSDTIDGVVPADYFAREVERANLTWSSACVRIVPNNSPPQLVDTEPQLSANSPGNTNAPNWIIDKNGHFDERKIETLIGLLKAAPYNVDMSDPKEVLVIYVPDSISGAWAGRTIHPAIVDQGQFSSTLLQQKTVIFVVHDTVPARRILAHELGHALTNDDPDGQVQNTPELVFPAPHPKTDNSLDQTVTPGRMRWLTEKTEADATHCRPSTDLAGTGNQIFASFSDPCPN